MYTLENFLANNKFKDNINKLYSDSPYLSVLKNRLHFNDSLSNPALEPLSNVSLELAKTNPKILRDWQGDEIRTNNVKGYYQNPFRTSGGSILTNTIDKLLSNLSPGYNIDPITNKPIPIQVIGLESIQPAINNITNLSNAFLEHTDRLSNVVPQDHLIYLPQAYPPICNVVYDPCDYNCNDHNRKSTHFCTESHLKTITDALKGIFKPCNDTAYHCEHHHNKYEAVDYTDEFPHYYTALSLARTVSQLAYQTDKEIEENSTKIVLGCFTSLFAAQEILSQSTIDNIKSTTNTILSNSSISTDANNQSILTISLSPTIINNINNDLNNISSSLQERMTHDILFYRNMLKVEDDAFTLTYVNDAGQTQKDLINLYVGTNKLKNCINIEDLPPDILNVSIDYYGNINYSPSPDNIPKPNSYVTIVNDYINNYNTNTLNINTDKYNLIINPAALLFNTTNGTWYNRSITITNSGNKEWDYHNIYVNDFNYTEVKCNINWADTTNGTTSNNTINSSEYVFREKTYIHTINVKNNYINFALANNGGIASVSSNTKSVINNGSRYYTNTNSTWYPSHQANTDYAIIEFNTTKTINKINFISTPITLNNTEPTTDLNSYYIIPNINIEYWNGNTWILIETIISNKSIIEVNFDPITTNKIRTYCTHTDWFNILELEAWGYEPLNYKSNTFINNGLDYIIQYKDTLNTWKIIPNGNILNTSNNFNTILINKGIITDTIKITSNQSSYYQYSNPIELELIGVPYYNTLQPNNSITLSIDVRSLIPTDYNDYGNITIENVEIPIRIINSNNDIGIMAGLDTNVIIGSSTNKLLINETNGPYQLLSNNPSLQNYTYINKTEYPVTINDIIPLYDNSNADIILIDAEYPITLNTNDYILLSANVIPYNTNIDDFGWLIVTEDGQERILKLFITNIDDSNLYNENIIVSSNNINISNGRPYDIVTVTGPNIISPFYLDNNGEYSITDIDSGTYILKFGTGHIKTIGGTNNIINNDITITVGDNGDFDTINAALEHLSNYTTSYKANGINVIINLLSGFEMNEQVVVKNGVDLGWITITGVDVSTNVASTVWTNENAITTSYDEDNDSIPLFLFSNMSTGPVISQVFVDPNEDIYDPYRFGVWCENGSTVVMNNGGMNNFDIGCAILDISNGHFFESVFYDSSDSCIWADNFSKINVDDCIGDCTNGVGVSLDDGSSGRIVGCIFSDCAVGIKLEGVCTARIQGDFTDCDIGILIEAGSTAEIRDTQVSGYISNGVINYGSHVYISDSNLTKLNNSTTASTNCVVNSGGITTIWDSTSGISQTKNTITSAGIIFAQ